MQRCRAYTSTARKGDLPKLVLRNKIQWQSPCAVDEVVRAIPDGSLPVTYIDDKEFAWDEFGRMLCTYAGWGMRIIFVPDDELEQAPRIVVGEPGK